MRLIISETEIEVTLSSEDTDTWGNGWPFPQVSGKEVTVKYNNKGPYFISIDHEEVSKRNSNMKEITSMVEDYVSHNIPMDHPCYSIIIA